MQKSDKQISIRNKCRGYSEVFVLQQLGWSVKDIRVSRGIWLISIAFIYGVLLDFSSSIHISLSSVVKSYDVLRAAQTKFRSKLFLLSDGGWLGLVFSNFNIFFAYSQCLHNLAV